MEEHVGSAGIHDHLDCDGAVHRFTVLFEEQLQPLFGHGRLPAAEHGHTSVIGRMLDPTQTPPGGHSPDAAGSNGEGLAVLVHPHRVFKDGWTQRLLSADTQIRTRFHSSLTTVTRNIRDAPPAAEES